MLPFTCPYERHYCGARKSKAYLNGKIREITRSVGNSAKFNKTGTTKQRGNCYFEISVDDPGALPDLNQYIYQIELTFTRLKYVRTNLNFGTEKDISKINSLTTVGFGSVLKFAFDVKSTIFIAIESDSRRKYRIPDFAFKVQL